MFVAFSLYLSGLVFLPYHVDGSLAPFSFNRRTAWGVLQFFFVISVNLFRSIVQHASKKWYFPIREVFGTFIRGCSAPKRTAVRWSHAHLINLKCMKRVYSRPDLPSSVQPTARQLVALRSNPTPARCRKMAGRQAIIPPLGILLAPRELTGGELAGY